MANANTKAIIKELRSIINSIPEEQKDAMDSEFTKLLTEQQRRKVGRPAGAGKVPKDTNKPISKAQQKRDFIQQQSDITYNMMVEDQRRGHLEDAKAKEDEQAKIKDAINSINKQPEPTTKQYNIYNNEEPKQTKKKRPARCKLVSVNRQPLTTNLLKDMTAILNRIEIVAPLIVDVNKHLMKAHNEIKAHKAQQAPTATATGQETSGQETRRDATSGQ